MLEILSLTDQHATMLGDEPLKLTLVFQDRQRSRLRVVLSSGQEAALLLPRGTVLRGGDTLALSDGRVVLVEAAPETVSTVTSLDPTRFARAAYHLGNRHVPLQVGEGFLRYLHDHVLDGMVGEQGLTVVVEQAPFEPESGAYGKHTHGAGGHSHAQGGHADELALARAAVPRALGLVEVASGEASVLPRESARHVR
jgi:urease accessory protein